MSGEAAAGVGGVVAAPAVAASVVLTPAEQVRRAAGDARFRQLLATRQALRFSIADLKAKPDNLANLEAQLAAVEDVIREDEREDPELVNLDQQAADALERAKRSAAAALEDKQRAEDLARKLAEQQGGAASQP